MGSLAGMRGSEAEQETSESSCEVVASPHNVAARVYSLVAEKKKKAKSWEPRGGSNSSIQWIRANMHHHQGRSKTKQEDIAGGSSSSSTDSMSPIPRITKSISESIPTFVPTRRGTPETKRDLEPAAKENDADIFAVHGKYACIIMRPFALRKVIWDLIGVVFLLWTIVLTPLRLGFDVEDFCPSSIWIWEFTIDCFFMMDLVLNFFTAVYVESDTGNMLSSDMCDIAWDYLKHWFLIDLVSSLPVDAILALALEGCNGAPDSSESSSKLGALSMIRILRLVKLFRIFRALKLQARSARPLPSRNRQQCHHKSLSLA